MAPLASPGSGHTGGTVLPLVLLAGPTASGKSELALALAEQLGGEIISVDSMQVYRGMDIGTAKPSAAERAHVPHHLVDIIDLSESFDAARFVSAASRAIEEIRSRARLPILCGGTGLYFRAFLEGLGEGPPTDPALRAELQATPLPVLLQELQERDPTTFERIDRHNLRRVIRAVAVIRITGRPFSELRSTWKPAPQLQGVVAFGISRQPEDLHERIHRRVDLMFERGLVAETEQLIKVGLETNITAMQALGYRQVAEYLRGMRSLPETIALVKSRTRSYAKRQLTWFRRQMQLEWITLTPTGALDAAARQLSATVARQEH